MQCNLQYLFALPDDDFNPPNNKLWQQIFDMLSAVYQYLLRFILKEKSKWGLFNIIEH